MKKRRLREFKEAYWRELKKIEERELKEEVDYSKKTKVELLDIAEEKGIEVNSIMTKAEIIKLLEE